MSESQSKPKRGCGRVVFRSCLFVFALLMVCAVTVVIGAVLVYQHVTQPGVPGQTIRIVVPAGATGGQIAQILADNHLVENPMFFRIALRLDRSNKPMKAGRYAVPQGLSATELLHVLQEGKTVPPEPGEIPPDQKVTIPEGLSLKQASALFANPEAFVAAACDPALLRRLDVAATSLEGFLMPDTYYFDRKPTEREVVERMVEQFEKEWAALTAVLALPEGISKTELVTIASLIEEEAKVPEERDKVAAVIYNRLKKRMPLQLDSTLQYALNKYGQRLLYEDREVDSPYNTYKNPGLPPGPISSPGVASLRAALCPADADYVYFVSNADGQTHTFSTTEAEHLEAVSRFRKEIAPQRKALEKGNAP